jgi:hypothetical protein
LARSDGEGELPRFIEGELAGAEGIPGEDVPLGEGVESGGVGFEQFAEAVVGDGFAGFGKGHFGAHFFAGAIEHGPCTAEDVEGGAKGAEVEVDATDVVGFKFGGALLDQVGEFGFDVVPPGGTGVGVALAADEEDGAGDGVFLGLVQVLRVLGANGPTGGDFKPGIDEGFGEHVPGTGVFVVELHGHHAVVAEDAEVFGKGEGHFGFVVAVGEFFGRLAHVAESGGVCDGFAVFVGEF